MIGFIAPISTQIVERMERIQFVFDTISQLEEETDACDSLFEAVSRMDASAYSQPSIAALVKSKLTVSLRVLMNFRRAEKSKKNEMILLFFKTIFKFKINSDSKLKLEIRDVDDTLGFMWFILMKQMNEFLQYMCEEHPTDKLIPYSTVHNIRFYYGAVVQMNKRIFTDKITLNYIEYWADDHMELLRDLKTFPDKEDNFSFTKLWSRIREVGPTDKLHLDEDVECSICLEPNISSTNYAVLDSCPHVFCEKCLHDYFSALW